MFNKRFAGLVLMGAALGASSAAFAAGDRDFNTAAGAVLGAAIGSQNGGGHFRFRHGVFFSVWFIGRRPVR